METERMRIALELVSHDLRTPLATIIGPQRPPDAPSARFATRRDLVRSIHGEASPSRPAGGIASWRVTRLESGAVPIRQEPQALTACWRRAPAAGNPPAGPARCASISPGSPARAHRPVLIGRFFSISWTCIAVFPAAARSTSPPRCGAHGCLEVSDRGRDSRPGDDGVRSRSSTGDHSRECAGSGSVWHLPGIVEIHGGTSSRRTDRRAGPRSGSRCRSSYPSHRGSPMADRRRRRNGLDARPRRGLIETRRRSGAFSGPLDRAWVPPGEASRPGRTAGRGDTPARSHHPRSGCPISTGSR